MPQGWTRTDRTDPETDPVDAEAAAGAVYRSPDGGDYAVRVYRWDSNGAAREGVDEFANWTAYVVLGNFSFLVRGPDEDDAFEILGASPAFDEAFARENNLMD